MAWQKKGAPAKLSVLVLEKLADPHSPLKGLPFGLRGLWGPSIEAFYRRGILEPIAAEARPAGAPGQSSQLTPGGAQRGPAGHFAGVQFDHANIDTARWTYRLPGPSSTQLGSAMEALDRVLAAHAISAGVEIRRGHGVDSFETKNDDVTVHSGAERFRACPDFELEDGTRLGTLLRDGNGLLLDFGRPSLRALDGLCGEVRGERRQGSPWPLRTARTS